MKKKALALLCVQLLSIQPLAAWGFRDPDRAKLLNIRYTGLSIQKAIRAIHIFTAASNPSMST